MKIAEVLRRLEERLLENSVRKDAGLVSSMLAEEFLEFGSSGRVFDKRETVALLQSAPPIDVSIADFDARLLADGVALVTYRTSKRDSTAEAGGQTTHALRSSIWVSRDGQWQALFHQGTKTGEPDGAMGLSSERKNDVEP